MLGETGIPGNQGEKVTNVSFCHAKYRVKATYADPRRIYQRTFGICSAKDYPCILDLHKTVLQFTLLPTNKQSCSFSSVNLRISIDP